MVDNPDRLNTGDRHSANPKSERIFPAARAARSSGGPNRSRPAESRSRARRHRATRHPRGRNAAGGDRWPANRPGHINGAVGFEVRAHWRCCLPCSRAEREYFRHSRLPNTGARGAQQREAHHAPLRTSKKNEFFMELLLNSAMNSHGTWLKKIVRPTQPNGTLKARDAGMMRPRFFRTIEEGNRFP